MLKDVCILTTSHNVSKTYIQSLVDNGFTPSKIIYANIVKKSNKKQPSFFAKLKGKISAILHSIGNSNQPVSANNTDYLAYYLPFIHSFLQENNLCSLDLRIDTKSLLHQLNLKFDEVNVTSINDPTLASYLVNEVKEKYIIFCGGGILKKNMFETGKKFIHFHPGVVPQVKGADCLLWSVLVKNEVGMSAFFMNEGIDTGEIILTKTYPIPKLFNSSYYKPTEKLPSILINYLDPAYRADALISIFKNDKNPSNWATKQQEGVGEYYHFMHPRIAAMATKRFMK